MFSKKVSFDPVIQLSILFISTLVLLSVARGYFFIVNQTFFDATASEILSAFLFGVKFDGSVLALISAVPVLIIIALSWLKLFNRYIWVILYPLLVVGYVATIAVNIFDTHYFPYTGKRSGPEAFVFIKEAAGQVGSLLYTYWIAIVTVAVLSVVLILISRRIRKISLIERSWLWYLPGSALLFLVVALVARGGLDSKPLSPAHAYGYGNVSLAPLINNSMFNLLKEEPGNLAVQNYFPTDTAARDVLQPKSLRKEPATPSKQNVVILILESFGMEYFGPPFSERSYMPFLNSLAKESLFFPYALANGRRSIEAMPSIFAGLPSLMSEPFSTSAYQSNVMHGVGNILLDYGYSSAFFHGAKNGSMYFDATSARFGFTSYFGLNEYPNSDDFDGQWGIYDEPFLQYALSKIDTMPKPFLASIFTLSSHPPYSIPQQYADVIEPGEIPMHKAVRYVDLALSKFFAEAKRQPWFDNTTFVITADHTSDNWDKNYSSVISRHQIPIIVFGKGVTPGVNTSIVQQADILPSLISLLHLPEESRLLPFGQSFLEGDFDGEGVFYDQSAFWHIRGGRFVKISTVDGKVENGELPKSFDGVKAAVMDDDQALKRLKATIQVYTNGLIDNKLYQR